MHNDTDKKLFGLIGYPVAHSASPAMHNAAFRENRIAAEYLLLPVEKGHLKDAFTNHLQAGFQGFNITFPHKQEIIELGLLTSLDESAERIGAVNTVIVKDKQIRGYNTDGQGFIRACEEQFGSIAEKRICVLGCGGAGSALAVQASFSGIQRLVVADIDRKKMDDLFAKVSSSDSSCEVIGVSIEDAGFSELVSSSDILIDATPLGMNPNDPASPFVPLIGEHHIVCDLVYHPSETPLLLSARERGARSINGFGMLLFQGVLAFELWTDTAAPVEVMRKTLEVKVYGE